MREVSSSSARAICRSASFFACVGANASAAADSLAARALASTCAATSMLSPPARPAMGRGPHRSQQHQVVAMDHFVAALIPQGSLDLRGLGAADPSELCRLVVGEPTGELGAVELHQGDDSSGFEVPF